MADTVGYAEHDFEWENVHEESPDQLQFEEIGDTYIGQFEGSERITFTDKNDEAQEFTQLRFRDPDGLKVLNAGYELESTFVDVPPKSFVRIRLMKFVDVGQASKMKSYRVDVGQRTTKK